MNPLFISAKFHDAEVNPETSLHVHLDLRNHPYAPKQSNNNLSQSSKPGEGGAVRKLMLLEQHNRDSLRAAQNERAQGEWTNDGRSTRTDSHPKGHDYHKQLRLLEMENERRQAPTQASSPLKTDSETRTYLKDYEVQLGILEEQNKRRLEMMRNEYHSHKHDK